MKKLLTFMILLLFAININAQSDYVDFKANYIVLTDGISTVEDSSDVTIRMYINSNRIVIFSEERQIIDYVPYRQYRDEDNWLVEESNATDTYYRNIILKMMLSPNRQYLIVSIGYNDILYTYSAKIVVK